MPDIKEVKEFILACAAKTIEAEGVSAESHRGRAILKAFVFAKECVSKSAIGVPKDVEEQFYGATTGFSNEYIRSVRTVYAALWSVSSRQLKFVTRWAAEATGDPSDVDRYRELYAEKEVPAAI